MRLNRYLALHGIATRREADTLIEQGRVFVNGQKAELGMRVTDADDIAVEEANRRKLVYIAYYKPRGIIPVTLSNAMWQALGSAIIFGLMFSSFLTLFIIPVLYRMLASRQEQRA